MPLLAFVAVTAFSTPPPSPPPLAAPAPAATPTLPPGIVPLQTPAASAKASPTPPPPQSSVDANRVGISGVWEVQIQRDSQTVYTHFKLAQHGNALIGQYLDADNKKYPVAGSIDGKVVRLVVSLPNGASITFSGTEDGGTDMLGMVQTATDAVGFTATYRPKYRWIDNLNPNPGLGNQQPGIP